MLNVGEIKITLQSLSYYLKLPQLDLSMGD